ncbi:hypothetical protein D3H35_21095 [Cohnella faecalis]|uniref:Uncharacterized protein n=1 Tax=Cohnella faecalis TaxID=2315694 RepID=A0A398CUV6_9BACL|nr:hypothetical protein D3H35_21095 [Cohnella faecalis]
MNSGVDDQQWDEVPFFRRLAGRTLISGRGTILSTIAGRTLIRDAHRQWTRYHSSAIGGTDA